MCATRSAVVIVQFLVGVMRMRADRAVNVGKTLGDRQHIGELAHARRDRDHARDAGRSRARDNGVELVGKIRKIQMAMAVDQHGYCAAGASAARRSVGKPAVGAGSLAPAAMPMFAAEEGKRPLIGRHRQKIEQLFRRCRHERLRQDGDLPQNLGGHVEHRALPRRIGLGQRPWRLAGEIAIGIGDHRPDGIEHLVQLLRLHRPRAPCRSWRRRRRGSPRSAALKRRGFGSTPPNCRATIVSERCARLPRSLARSALMRLTIASWL